MNLYRGIVDFDLPPAGQYGTGIIFLPRDEMTRSACRKAWDKALERTGLPLLGWREVPTNNDQLGTQCPGS